MFCKNCGSILPEHANFCTNCGKAANEPMNEPSSVLEPEMESAPTAELASEPVSFFADTQNEYVPVEPVNPLDVLERSEREASILKMGILSLAFADTGILSWLGIIFACITRGRVSAYMAKYGELRGRAKVGHILGKIGLGLGIGLTVFFFVYFCIIVLAVLMEIMYL